MNPARRRLDTSVHRFVRASSRTRTQHRGTRTRTRWLFEPRRCGSLIDQNAAVEGS